MTELDVAGEYGPRQDRLATVVVVVASRDIVWGVGSPGQSSAASTDITRRLGRENSMMVCRLQDWVEVIYLFIYLLFIY